MNAGRQAVIPPRGANPGAGRGAAGGRHGSRERIRARTGPAERQWLVPPGPVVFHLQVEVPAEQELPASQSVVLQVSLTVMS